MGSDANADDDLPRSPRPVDPADEARLRQAATALADGIDAHLASWVVSSVERIWGAWTSDGEPAPLAAAEAAGAEARRSVVPAVRALLESDLDAQRTTPLALLRDAVAYPTAVLRDAGVPPVVRDAAAERHFPDDDYDLVIATFADIDASLAEAGLVWGAAKAHVHLARRRAEGR